MNYDLPRLWTSVVLCGSVIPLAAGCTGDSEPKSPAAQQKQAVAEKKSPAEAAWEDMVSAYRAAQSYSDEGKLLIELTAGGQVEPEPPLPLEVAFERPAKLHFHLGQARLTADGKTMRMTIDGVPDQVVERETTLVPRLADLTGDEYFLHAIKAGMPRLVLPQLQLLLEPEPFAEIVREASLASGEEQLIDERLCRAVEVATGRQKYIFWIDGESHVLRRLELPPAVAEPLVHPDRQYDRLSVRIDFNKARFNPELPEETFTWEPDDRRHRLRRFVAPLPPGALDIDRLTYEADLARASLPTTTVEVLQAKIAPRSDPKYFAIRQLWSAEGLKRPGNVAVWGSGDQQRIFVIDQGRDVVELAPDGTMRTRHDLQLPENSSVSMLRIADNEAGLPRFALAASQGQKVFLFDQDWKPLTTYPDQRHSGIGDVQLVESQAEGGLEMVVGYWGVVGVQGVSLAGERLWRNRDLENVLQIAPDRREEGLRLLCVTTRGSIIVLDDQGRSLGEISVGRFAVTSLVAADLDQDGNLERCALVVRPGEGPRVTAIGLDAELRPVWQYPLPPGVHRTGIERIIPARLSPTDGGWLLPGADGSIHLLSAKGEPVDQFNYGAAIHGLAATLIDDSPVILIATQQGATAWEFEARAEP